MSNELSGANFNCEYFKKSLEKFRKDLIMIDDVITFLPKKDVIYLASEVATIKEQIEGKLEKKIGKII